MQKDSRKLLIVKPPYKHSPLGMAYVLSCLERNNIPFDFIDTTLTNPDYSKLLKKNDYLAFATGGLISNFNFISQTIHTIRSIKPGLPIIIGGNITKDVNPRFLFDSEMMGIDFGIIGEAETSLPCLIDELSNGSDDFKEVPGLLFKDRSSSEVIKNHPKRLDLQDINILPAWHHININYYKYAEASYMHNQVVLPVLTGRGCVGVCTFCSPTIGAFRKRPLEHIMEEIEFLLSKYNFDILNFVNEMFYQTKEDILRFCEEYKRLKTKKPWMCGMRVDVKNIDVDTFVAMKEAGCVLTGAGIESSSNKILKIMKKQTTKEEIIKFYRAAKEAKIPCLGTFMVGNEGETKEDLKETIDMVINEEMNADVSLVDAYPGTQIYKSALKRGLINDEKDYYKNIHLTPGPYDLLWRNRERYLNISAISNDRFWSVVFSELRCFYTFLFNRFKVLDVKYKRNWLLGTISVNGICSECGSTVKVLSDYNLLGQLTYCPKCYIPLHINYYKLEDFFRHYDMLCEELRSAEKLVIAGTQLQAMNILRYDHFGLNYERIKGFLELERKKDSSPLFAHMPILQIEKLLSIAPDKILIADDPTGDAELMIKMFYSKNGTNAPKILHLVPDNKRFSLKITRYVSKFTTGKGHRGAFDRIIWGLVIKLLRFGALFLKIEPTLKQISKRVLRRLFGATFTKELYLKYILWKQKSL
ncbi:MAG: hypothetical protein A3H37_06325 [Candidatus Schekmanbacteria bacterium RIFCSPLOWO2_02_FULL_38_14]|nr:MAG: hypothetical protein A3H37_06325 [Candidatus Schekmanbacteria bacterium RIFCSPLOWO2_02_FULL_38_14]